MRAETKSAPEQTAQKAEREGNKRQKAEERAKGRHRRPREAEKRNEWEKLV